jgi:hypothetical protein
MHLELLHRINSWFRGFASDGWTWIDSLNREQWLLFLGLTSVLGFMCMRGFGSRKEF